MARFTVRVQLHDAEWRHYETLYENMATQGFTDVITTEPDGRVKMPPGEYNYIGDVAKDEVLAKAERAAAGTGKKYSILVTQSAGRTWKNLEKA